MKSIIFFGYCVMLAGSIYAQDQWIYTIPFNQYSFSSDNLNGSLIILGWSRNGRIMYEYSTKDGNSKDYVVMDLVNDETFYPQFEQYH